MKSRSKSRRVALVWRGGAEDRGSAGYGRFEAVAQALRHRGLVPTPCVYDESVADDVRRELSACAGALVWVNPNQDGLRRQGFDDLLAELSAGGLIVSARPDVIGRLGVKSVLWRSRAMGWSGDAWFYEAPDALEAGLTARLADGPRVLKPERGNGGVGVWRVERVAPGHVEVMEATGRQAYRIPLEIFVRDRRAEFVQAGDYVDQALQPRLLDGMFRAYLSADRGVGFGWQKVRALAPPECGPSEPRSYSGPEDPRFQRLRAQLETRWVSERCGHLALEADDLSAVWDADFIFGPKDEDGADTYVLCEINASNVSPMPYTAPAAIAETMARRLGV